MPRLRLVKHVSAVAQEQLAEAFRSAPDFTFRKCARAVLLSAAGHTISQLQAIFDADRDTIAAGFDRFEAGGVEGLKSHPKPGRPPIYTQDEVGRLKALVGAEPRQIQPAQAALQQVTGKSSCTATLKRALKNGYAWPRCRRSVKGRRDPGAFARERDNQKARQALADAGLTDRFHFDVSGFATVPSVPYAWPPVGTALALPGFKSRRLNGLGFLSKGQGAFFRHAEGPVDPAGGRLPIPAGAVRETGEAVSCAGLVDAML